MAKGSSDLLTINLSHLISTGQISLSEAEQIIVDQDAGQLTVNQLLSIAERSGVSVERLIGKALKPVPADLKMLVMDCDGVLTDGGMTFTKSGDEIKRFNAKDGLGLKQLQKSGWQLGIISAGISTGLVEKRAQMLGIERVYVGQAPKLEILDQWLADLGLKYQEVCYIGDDLSDLPILERVGYSACPANAVKAVLQAVDQVLQLPGGEGCVRELIDDHLLATDS